MSLRVRSSLLVVFLCSCAPFLPAQSAPREPGRIITEMCAGCHGPNLVGGQAGNLLDDIWKSGGDDESLLRSIRTGFPQLGMAGFAGVLTEPEMRSLVTEIRRLNRQFALGSIKAATPAPDAVVIKSEKHTFRLETVAAPLDTPWGIVFLPDGTMLVSDRIGVIRSIKDGRLAPAPIRNTPKPFVRQDGGFLDLIAHPDYAQNGWLYLAYTELAEDGRASMTRIVRGKLRDGAWVEEQDIFRVDQKYYYEDTSHYGCRFLFDRAGHLFFTIGERGKALDAQDLTTPHGKIHRIFDDGRIPPDNPFVGRPGAWESIWSLGNRHVQGLQFHPVTGKLWATEHGPRGGDELNRIEPGRNYGWPIISYGQAQRTEVIEGTTRAGMEQPVAWWSPSVAPSAIDFSTSERFPRWKNDLFVAYMVGRQLRRLETDGDKVTHQEILFSDMGRVRDVVMGPDGFIYLALNNPGRIARMVPVETAPEPPAATAAPAAAVAPAAAATPAAAGGTPGDADAGEAVYVRTCMACHQFTGLGLPGAFPPLAGSSIVTEADPGRIIRIVLHGLQGPIEVKGVTFNSIMPPPIPTMTDQEVADVLTYVRSDWGNAAPPVTVEAVTAIRTNVQRATPWTWADLEAELKR